MALPIQINSLAMDFEDLRQDKFIIKHLVNARYSARSEVEKAKLINASYRNYNMEQYLIARENVRLLQRSLTRDEYYHLLNWFFNGGYKGVKKTLAYYRFIAKIRQKCKFILENLD